MPEHKILIVEDEEAIAHVMESILSANHYIPLSAKNGGQALALASAERPDLVLLDLGLPDMDGVEVLRSNYYTYFENVWTKFHHLRSTTLKDHYSTKEAIDRAHAYALEQGTFDQKVFYEAFGIFDNQSIEKSLVSENPLVRIFALLDRRLGKRRLLALEESMEQELDWVRAFYVIRMQAEGLMEKE